MTLAALRITHIGEFMTIIMQWLCYGHALATQMIRNDCPMNMQWLSHAHATATQCTCNVYTVKLSWVSGSFAAEEVCTWLRRSCSLERMNCW